MQEFKNSKENGLGIALPKGRVRFYRRDTDGSLQFIGENQIDHTPKDETLRLYTGNAFDVVGERKETDFQINRSGHQADESFEIKIRNHKKEASSVGSWNTSIAGATGRSRKKATSIRRQTRRRSSFA